MKPDPQFLNQPKAFWANVRLVSEKLGYTQRGDRQIKVPVLSQVRRCYEELGLIADHLIDADGRPTPTGNLMQAYFVRRADALNRQVEPNLMDAKAARGEYDRLRKQLRPQCPLPMNKQKGEKRAPAYLTGIVNMLIEAHAEGFPCDHDPRGLTTITFAGSPLRTLARRVDGCFPSKVDPIAVWEIKEYYYTTTFGSRVADGVYESLLDGMELEELRDSENIDVKHYLIVDAHYTWWERGRSYLCRIYDMLHMGYLDEALFGREVIERLPVLVKEWVELARQRGEASS